MAELNLYEMTGDQLDTILIEEGSWLPWTGTAREARERMGEDPEGFRELLENHPLRVREQIRQDLSVEDLVNIAGKYFDMSDDDVLSVLSMLDELEKLKPMAAKLEELLNEANTDYEYGDRVIY